MEGESRLDILDEPGTAFSFIDRLDNSKFLVRGIRADSIATVEPEDVNEWVMDAAFAPTDSLVLPNVNNGFMRDPDGNVIDDIVPGETISNSDGEGALIELEAPLKAYIRTKDDIEVTANPDHMKLSLVDGEGFWIGARPRRTHPNSWIKVPDTPSGLAEGIPYLANSLYGLSPERSWSTLRGYPPLIHRGSSEMDSVEAPHLEPTTSDVIIEVPFEYDWLFPTVPLAYYVAASIEPGDTPCLHTPNGSYDLQSDDPFHDTIQAKLSRMLIGDMLVRTHGLYPIPLVEYDAIIDDLPFDPEVMYEASVGERADAYLSIPDQAFERIAPTWGFRVYIPFEPRSVPLLPHVVKELVAIAPPDAPEVTPIAQQEFGTEQTAEIVKSSAHTVATGSTDSAGQLVPNGGQEWVRLDEPPCLIPCWAGNGYATGTVNIVPETFERRVERERTRTGRTTTGERDDSSEVATVRGVFASAFGRKALMRTPEGAVGNAQAITDRRGVQIDIEQERTATTDMLETWLTDPEINLLHFSGHVSDEGIHCADGVLDAHTVESVGVDAITLNSCASIRQAHTLVNRGAITALATTKDILHGRAATLGYWASLLLMGGYQYGHIVYMLHQLHGGKAYTMLGDPGFFIGQRNSTNILIQEVLDVNPDAGWDDPAVKIVVHSVPQVENGMGSIFQPSNNPTNQYRFLGQEIGPYWVTRAQIDQLKTTEEIAPFIQDSQLYFVGEIDPENLPFAVP